MDIQTAPSLSQLESQAVNAAKNQLWEDAVKYNQLIIVESCEDLGAHNRLGVAFSQLNQNSQAKAEFEQVLSFDKSNQIAKKNLAKLKNKQGINVCSLNLPVQFIEEPGRTKVVELHRLAGRDVLDKLIVGEQCQLKPKSRYVSIESLKSCYIGSLPEDISFNISKLIRSNNTYVCFIRSISPISCSVFIAELKRSKENEFIHSFPTSRSSSNVEDFYLEGEDTTLLEEIAAPDNIGSEDFEHPQEVRRHFGEEPAEEAHESDEMREEKEREEMN